MLLHLKKALAILTILALQSPDSAQAQIEARAFESNQVTSSTNPPNPWTDNKNFQGYFIWNGTGAYASTIQQVVIRIEEDIPASTFYTFSYDSGPDTGYSISTLYRENKTFEVNAKGEIKFIGSGITPNETTYQIVIANRGATQSGGSEPAGTTFNRSCFRNADIGISGTTPVSLPNHGIFITGTMPAGTIPPQNKFPQKGAYGSTIFLRGNSAESRARRMTPEGTDIRKHSFIGDPIDTGTRNQIQNAPLFTIPGEYPTIFTVQKNVRKNLIASEWNNNLSFSGSNILYHHSGQEVVYEPSGTNKHKARIEDIRSNPGFISTNFSGTTLTGYTLHKGEGLRWHYNSNGEVLAKESNGRFLDVTSSGTYKITDRATGNFLSISGTTLADHTATRTGIAFASSTGRDQTSADGTTYRFDDGGWSGTTKGGNKLLVNSTLTLYSNNLQTHRQIVSQQDALGQTMGFVYTNTTSNNLLTTATDRKAKVWKYLHTEELNLLSVTTPLNLVTSYTYDGTSGYRLTTTNPDNKTTSFEYSDYGFVTKVTDPKGEDSNITYDDALNITEIEDREGNLTKFTFDGSNRLVSGTNALNESWSQTLNANGQVTSFTDPASNSLTNTYTSGRRTAATDREGYTTTFTYHNTGFLQKIIDSGTNTIEFSAYDGMGRPTTIKSPRSGTTTIAYNFRGQQTSLTNALGQVWSSTYNANGYLTKLVLPAVSGTSAQIQYGYDSEDLLTSQTDELTKVTTFTYDDDKRLTGSSDPDGVAWSQTLNGRGLPLTHKNDAGTVTETLTYDDNGNVATLTDSGTNTWTNAYDKEDRLIGVTRPDSLTLSITRDALGRPTAYASTGTLTTSQTFNALGALTGLTNPASGTHSFTYDKDGRPTGETTPGGKATSITYNARALPDTLTEPGSRVTNFTYDADGNTASLTDSIGTITYTRDLLGRITQSSEVRGSTHTLDTTYNFRNQPTSFTDWHSGTTAYQYNARGDLTKVTYPGNKEVNYTYTDAGRIASLTDWNTRVTNYTYDSEGRLSTKTRPNGVVETRSYDLEDRLTQIKDALGGTTISQVDIEYNAIGQISKETYTPAPAGTLDGLGNPAPSLEKIYTYDDDGRLLGCNVNAGALSWTILSDSRSNSTGYSWMSTLSQTPWIVSGTESLTVDTDNGATDYMGVPISRNSAGEMTLGPTGLDPSSVSGKSFTWNARGQLTSGGRVYDTNGELVEDSTHTYTVDAYGRRIASDNGSSVTNYIYGPTGLEYSIEGSSEEHLSTDARGSVLASTDASGTVVGRWFYGPFGELLVTEGTSSNHFLFLGSHGCTAEPTLGVYKLGVRYYAPNLRQFLSIDPVLGSLTDPGSLNRFAYCGGDPINSIDPSGLCPNSLSPDGQPPTETGGQYRVVDHLPWWYDALPLAGSGTRAYYDFKEGYHGWGVVNTAFFVTDIFLVKAIAMGILKGGAVFVGRGGASHGYKALPGGVEIRQFGNYWIKQVNPHSSSFAQWWGKGSINAQAKSLKKLGDMGTPFLQNGNKIITRDAGAYTGDFITTWIKGSLRLKTPFNDIRIRNIGANGKIFDPAKHPIHQTAEIGATGLGIGVGSTYIYYKYQ